MQCHSSFDFTNPLALQLYNLIYSLQQNHGGPLSSNLNKILTKSTCYMYTAVVIITPSTVVATTD